MTLTTEIQEHLMTDYNAINARAIANPAAWVREILPGAAPDGRGGWSVPAHDAGDAEVIEGVLAHIAADGSGWYGEIAFADPLELLVVAGAAASRDEAAVRMVEHLGLAEPAPEPRDLAHAMSIIEHRASSTPTVASAAHEAAVDRLRHKPGFSRRVSIVTGPREASVTTEVLHFDVGSHPVLHIVMSMADGHFAVNTNGEVPDPVETIPLNPASIDDDRARRLVISLIDGNQAERSLLARALRWAAERLEDHDMPFTRPHGVCLHECFPDSTAWELVP